jgi:rare lipoprotein A
LLILRKLLIVLNLQMTKRHNMMKNFTALICLFGISLFLILPSFSYGAALTGKASWIGERFQGKKTASGELFDLNDLTASHATLPFGTLVKVTSDKTKKSVVVRINNRSEIDSGRIIDLSRRAAEQIGLIEEGIGLVHLEILTDKPKTATNNPGQPTVLNANNTGSKPASGYGQYQIQYGSFFDPDNANELKTALQRKGIQSTVAMIRGQNKTIYRVFSQQVYPSKENAQQALSLIAPQEGVIVSSKDYSFEEASSYKPQPRSTSQPTKPKQTVYEYGIQFGAFTSYDYAQDLQAQLLNNKGIHTIIHQFSNDQKRLYRVLSGTPFATEQQANLFMQEKAVPGIVLTFTK